MYSQVISSNGSNGEDTLREFHGPTSSGDNVHFNIHGSNETSPDEKSPDDIKVII